MRYHERMVTAPRDEEELHHRATALAGSTLGAVAARCALAVPTDLRRAKGWAGRVVETALGADGGSRAVHDFAHLGVELKTLPLQGPTEPRETTYVCTADLTSLGESWEASWVGRKLARVLWVPVEGDPAIPPGKRRVGTPWLWSPTAEQTATLRSDWEAFRERLTLEGAAGLTAHAGTWLQVRPKAAHGRARTAAFDAEGRRIHVNPRGFYLRTAFTRALLAEAFGE